MSFGIPVRNGLGLGLRASTTLSTGPSALRAALSLNFLSGTLDSRITFTRASTATFVGSNGYIQSAAINTARFDYDPVTLAAKGLLIEEQRTNLLTYSNTLTNAAWASTGITIATAAVTSPDGTASAFSATPAGNPPGSAYVIQNAAASTGVLTMYAKADTARYFLLVRGSYTANDYAVFDLQTGTITQAPSYAGSSATITAAGNGWYRCALISAQSATVNAYTISGASTGLSTPTSGQVYLYGAQLEASTFATSYIPTVASTVTRSADVATMTGTNFSSWYNQSAGTLITSADVIGVVSGAANLYSVDDASANNRIWSYSTGSGIVGRVTAAGTTTYDQTIGTVSLNTAFNTATAYAANSANTATNGVVGTTDTTVTVPTVTQMLLGASASGAYLNGHIRTLTYYGSRLTNTQLQTLTA